MTQQIKMIHWGSVTAHLRHLILPVGDLQWPTSSLRQLSKEGAIKNVWPFHYILRNTSVYQWKNKKIKDNLELSCLNWPVDNYQYPSTQVSLKNYRPTLEVQLLLTADVQLSCRLTHNRWTAVLHTWPIGPDCFQRFPEGLRPGTRSWRV